MREKIRKITWKSWVMAVGLFLVEYAFYRLGDFLSRLSGAVNHAWSPRIPFLDDALPLIPAFTLIYLFSYIFWICGTAAVSLTEKRNYVNYVIGLTLSCILGALIFQIYPTVMDREAAGLLEAAGRPGLFNWILRVIYDGDGGARAFNLFPSFHCMTSLYCCLGIRKQPEISRGFRVYTWIMTVLICLSTVLTGQHYVLDVAGGLLLAWLSWLLVGKIDPGKILSVKKT